MAASHNTSYLSVVRAVPMKLVPSQARFKSSFRLMFRLLVAACVKEMLASVFRATSAPSRSSHSTKMKCWFWIWTPQGRRTVSRFAPSSASKSVSKGTTATSAKRTAANSARRNECNNDVLVDVSLLWGALRYVTVSSQRRRRKKNEHIFVHTHTHNKTIP